MSKSYWIRGAGEARGPYDQLQIRGLVATGQLVPSMSISSDGTHWHVAGKVPGLFPDPPSDEITEFVTSTGEYPATPLHRSPTQERPRTTDGPANPRALSGDDRIVQIDDLSISATWRRRFSTLESTPGKPQFNILAALLGVFYYGAKGLWKKGVAYLIIVLIIDLLIDLLASFLHRPVPWASYSAPSFAIFGLLANRDVYRKVIFGETFWPRLRFRGHVVLLTIALAAVLAATVVIHFARTWQSSSPCGDPRVLASARKLAAKVGFQSEGDPADVSDAAALEFAAGMGIEITEPRPGATDENGRLTCTANVSYRPASAALANEQFMATKRVRYWITFGKGDTMYVQLSPAE